MCKVYSQIAKLVTSVLASGARGRPRSGSLPNFQRFCLWSLVYVSGIFNPQGKADVIVILAFLWG